MKHLMFCATAMLALTGCVVAAPPSGNYAPYPYPYAGWPEPYPAYGVGVAYYDYPYYTRYGSYNWGYWQNAHYVGRGHWAQGAAPGAQGGHAAGVEHGGGGGGHR